MNPFKMKCKFLAPVALLLLSGCAEMVKKNYAPTRSGTVRYNTGWMMAEKNREKALEEMRSYCGPARPQLMSEQSQSEFTGHSSSNTSVQSDSLYTSTTAEKTNYVYLNFKCVKNNRRKG